MEKGTHYEYNINMSALDGIKAALKKKMYAKVGVLSNGRPYQGTYGIAQIAAVHEFGAQVKVTGKMRAWLYHNLGVRLKRSTKYITIPKRSFLLNTMFYKNYHFQAFVSEMKEGIMADILRGDLAGVLKKFGLQWVAYVHEAFDTAGFGTWAPLKQLTWAIHSFKRAEGDPHHGHMTLIASGHLRQSIMSDVVEGS